VNSQIQIQTIRWSRQSSSYNKDGRTNVWVGKSSWIKQFEVSRWASSKNGLRPVNWKKWRQSGTVSLPRRYKYLII